MRLSGLLLGLYSLLVCVLAATSAGRTLFWIVAAGGAAGLVGGVQLAAKRTQGFGMAFVGVGVLLATGLRFLVLRSAFMVENGGMEGPEGRGSPLAFLIGLVFEQLVFSIPAACLLLALRRSYRLATAVPKAGL
jgi:hypothetical protein